MSETHLGAPDKDGDSCGQSAHAGRDAPLQKSAHAKEFLGILGRDTFEFRCFPDSEEQKNRGYSQRFVGRFEDHKHRLRNLNEAGYGIFVQVNASDGKGNKTSNINSAPAFFVDLDGAPRDNIERLPLSPHFISQTSLDKYHVFWLVSGIPLCEFKRVQQRLARLIESDKSVCDLARVMRLPGFLHQKNPDAPHLVQPELVGGHPAYEFEDFLDVLSAAEEKRGLHEGKRKRVDQKAQRGEAVDAELARARSAIQFLIGREVLNLGEYHEWFRMAAALKHSYQERGWPLFHEISSEAPGYKDEDDCRRQWDAIADPSDGNPLTIATHLKLARESGWTESSGNRRDESDNGAGGSGNAHRGGKVGGAAKPDQAAKVLEQADAAGDERFLDLDGRPHVRFERTSRDGECRLVTARIDSEAYRGVVRRRFYADAVTKVLSADQLTNAVALLEAEAVEADVRSPVYLRSGMHEGKLYIDLGRGDGRAVEVDAEGWRLLLQGPIDFVSGSRGALPIPKSGGRLSDLERHMPSLERADVQRVLAFAINTFNLQGTYPLLLFGGGHGSYKSTNADMTLAITDPPTNHPDARFSFGSNEQDLLIHASNARVLYFDNVFSSFGIKDSDTLCRLLSGAAFSTRKLYTSDEEHRIALRRPIIATSIETPSRRGDLLDRMLPVQARRSGHRLPEAVVWEAFEADKPKLFGLVLDGVSAALRNADAIAGRVVSGTLQLPRLADFAAFVEGAAEVLELEPGEFCAMLRNEQSNLQAEAAAGDSLGAALTRYFSIPGAKMLDVTASELLEKLSDGQIERTRGWPSVYKVRGHLQRIEPGLRDIGIDVQFTPPQGKRNVWSMKIVKTEAFCPNKLADPEI